MTEEEKQLVQVELSKDLVKRLEDYRFSRRFLSRAAAIRYLLNYALDSNPDAPPEAD